MDTSVSAQVNPEITEEEEVNPTIQIKKNTVNIKDLKETVARLEKSFSTVNIADINDLKKRVGKIEEKVFPTSSILTKSGSESRKRNLELSGSETSSSKKRKDERNANMDTTNNMPGGKRKTRRQRRRRKTYKKSQNKKRKSRRNKRRTNRRK